MAETKAKLIKSKDGIVGKVANRKKLVDIEFASGVTVIESGAFAGCTLLETVVFPDGLAEIQNSAFDGCVALKSISLPFSVRIIGGNAFNGCVNLNKVELNDGLEQIGMSAFRNCGAIACMKIPSSVKKVGDWAFFHNTLLTDIDIQCSADASFGYSVFEGCSSIKSVEIPGIDRMGGEMFAQCTCLKNVTIAEGVKIIGQRAFDGCAKLSGLKLPKSIVRIEEQAFDGCLDVKVEGRTMIKFRPHPFDEDQHKSLIEDFENGGCDLANSCGLSPKDTLLVDISILDQGEIADGLYWYDDPEAGFSWCYYWDHQRCAAEGALA
ncbi:MAG: leucine-rich repeat protein [bacterium]